MRRHGSSGRLGMHKTADRNGVLIYLAVKERKFAIIGDTGINSVVPLGFWDEIRDHMKQRFSENLFAEGLTEGIIMAGEQLKEHFPFSKDDINELTDTISFDINKKQGSDDEQKINSIAFAVALLFVTLTEGHRRCFQRPEPPQAGE